MDGNRFSDVDAWARAGIDALGHATDHMSAAGDADRRIALVSIDQGIEALITAYLRRGPGSTDRSTEAETARTSRANFRMKRDYVLRLALQHDIQTPTGDEFSLVRSIRNDIQHSGDWVVPSTTDVAVAFEIARATLRSLDISRAGERALPLRTGRVETRTAPVRPGAGASILAGRQLAEVAWEISQEIDPDQDGLHVRVLADRLAAMGIAGRNQTSLRDALNHAHDLFAGHGAAVWSWIAPSRGVNQGTSGQDLADLVAAVLAANDPAGRGMHAGRDILSVLERWGVEVKGQDKPATIRGAIRADARFERVSITSDTGGTRLRTAYRLRRRANGG